MTKIPRTPVTSSQIASVGHNAATNQIDIEFKSFSKPGQEPKPNNVYRYENFTADQFQAFLDAESKGKHFGATLKKETVRHPYRKLSPEEAAK